ncbi:hypothetical protein ACHAWF_006156 [Thalassiosira exigua]
MSEQLKPLCGVLDNVLERLSNVECKLGITPPRGSAAPSTSAAASPSAGGSAAAATTAAVVEDDDELHPRLAAYDEHVARALVPFVESCAALGPDAAKLGDGVRGVWDGVRLVVALGTKYKRPAGNVPAAIQPHLKPIQGSMASIQKL